MATLNSKQPPDSTDVRGLLCFWIPRGLWDVRDGYRLRLRPVFRVGDIPQIDPTAVEAVRRGAITSKRLLRGLSAPSRGDGDGVVNVLGKFQLREGRR